MYTYIYIYIYTYIHIYIYIYNLVERRALGGLDREHPLNELAHGVASGQRTVPFATEDLPAERIHGLGLEREVAYNQKEGC